MAGQELTAHNTIKHTSAYEGLRLPAPLSLTELEVRAQALAGRNVLEVAQGLQWHIAAMSTNQLDNRRTKGLIGQLVERALGADAKAGERPDFPELGVELKTIPVNGHGKPVESTFCCSINMLHAAAECWESSRLRQRLQCVLWLPVQSAKVALLSQRRFGQARLWRPNAVEQSLLQADWEDLMGAIGAGRGGIISAREGRVLQVRPKAAHAGVRTLGPGPDGIQKILPLGFYLRAACTARILQHGCIMVAS